MKKEKLLFYLVLLIVILAGINSSISCRTKLYKINNTIGFMGYGTEDSGYSMKIILTTDNLMLVEVEDVNNPDLGGFVIFKLSGIEADHLFGPFYRLGTSLWSFRYFPDATSVWKINLDLVDSFSESENDPLVDPILKSKQTVLILRENELQIWNDQILGSNDQILGKRALDDYDQEMIELAIEVISDK